MDTKIIESFAVTDNHTHPFPLTRIPAEVERSWSLTMFPSYPLNDIRNTSAFLNCSRMMCAYHGIEDVDEMLAYRKKDYESDPRAYTHALYQDANITTLLVDIGSPITNKRHTKEEMDQWWSVVKGMRIGLLNRIENVTDDLLLENLSFDDFASRLVLELKNMVERQRLIALKSVIAYRTGLAIRPLPIAEVRKGYYAYFANKNDREAIKVIRDYAFLQGSQVAAELDIPLQIHTGIGDCPLCDLRDHNPLLLHDALNDPHCRDTKIMLVHCGYPNVEYTAYLVAQYPNLYMDVSSMVPYAGHGVDGKLRQILELAPFTRVCYGSDTGCVPDLTWYAAKYFKKVLAKTLNQLEQEGIITENYAYKAAHMILQENVENLYKRLAKR